MKNTNNSIGIDLGIKHFVITSEGEVFNNLHFKKKESKKLKRLQKKLPKILWLLLMKSVRELRRKTERH